MMKLIECRENVSIFHSGGGSSYGMEISVHFLSFLPWWLSKSRDGPPPWGRTWWGNRGRIKIETRPSIHRQSILLCVITWNQTGKLLKWFLIFARNIYYQFQIFCKFAIIECLLDRTTTYLKGEFPVLAPAISWPPQSFRNTTNLVSAPPTR